jgi:hypothetical protein
MQGAYNFARIRSYISTCIKHEVSATDALNLAIQGDLPTFMEESLGWYQWPQGLYKKAIYVLLNGFYHQSDRIAEQFFQFI